MSGNVALVFVFNHRYDKNISLLNNLYESRFSNIFHLVPFYDGPISNVIPVYENSFYFQGYLAQGFKHYFSDQFEHYLFVADDMFINPLINETNYKSYFKLSENTSFIPEIQQLHHLVDNKTLRLEIFGSENGKHGKYYWSRIKDAVKYRHKKGGTEAENEMPSFSDAETLIKKHGYSIEPLTYQDVQGVFPTTFNSYRKRMQVLKYFFNLKTLKKKFHLAYPLVASYSDIVIVSKSSIKKFCHYCGVFAAKELFVEFAIPSALLLASDEVVTENQLEQKGEIYWTFTDAEAKAYEKQMQFYHYSVNELSKNFPNDKLYIHPIKLSKWKS